MYLFKDILLFIGSPVCNIRVSNRIVKVHEDFITSCTDVVHDILHYKFMFLDYFEKFDYLLNNPQSVKENFLYNKSKLKLDLTRHFDITLNDKNFKIIKIFCYFMSKLSKYLYLNFNYEKNYDAKIPCKIDEDLIKFINAKLIYFFCHEQRHYIHFLDLINFNKDRDVYLINFIKIKEEFYKNLSKYLESTDYNKLIKCNLENGETIEKIKDELKSNILEIIDKFNCNDFDFNIILFDDD